MSPWMVNRIRSMFPLKFLQRIAWISLKLVLLIEVSASLLHRYLCWRRLNFHEMWWSLKSVWNGVLVFYWRILQPWIGTLGRLERHSQLLEWLPTGISPSTLAALFPSFWVHFLSMLIRLLEPTPCKCLSRMHLLSGMMKNNHFLFLGFCPWQILI